MIRRLLFAIVLLLGCRAAAASEPENTTSLLSRYTFSWGAQIGGSIDMSGQNMSSIDFSATLGMHG